MNLLLFITVAEIQVAGLLGIDFLMYNTIGEAEISLKEDTIELGNELLPCIRIRSATFVRKVLIADNFEIPPMWMELEGRKL